MSRFLLKQAPRHLPELAHLGRSANQQHATIMRRFKTFVSFDYENDRHYRHLLAAWDKHPDFDFVFADRSSGEIDSNDVGRVKAALTAKINLTDVTLVIVGKYANNYHRDYVAIGYRNWINFEVARSKANGNRIVAIKLDRSFESPEELIGANASWALSFTENSIVSALREATRGL